MNGAWHISLRFTPDALRHGVEPLDLLARLQVLADSIQVATVDDGLPPLAGLAPQSCLLGFEVSLVTRVTRGEIESVFEDVREDCIVRLFPPTRRAADLVELLRALPQEGRLGDILVECGAITRQALDEALESQDAGHGKALGAILLGQREVAPDALAAALGHQARLRLQEGEPLSLPAQDAMLELADRLSLNLAIAGGPGPGTDTALAAAREDARRLRDILRNPQRNQAGFPPDPAVRG